MHQINFEWPVYQKARRQSWQKWGLMSIVVFFFIAIGILMMVAPWKEVLKESAKNVDLHFNEDDDDDDKQEKNKSELEIEA
eukprot:scaffold91444_cov52-Attheya_sp.AAC.5